MGINFSGCESNDESGFIESLRAKALKTCSLTKTLVVWSTNFGISSELCIFAGYIKLTQAIVMAAVSRSTLFDIRSAYHQAVESCIAESETSILLYAHFGNFNSSKIDCAIRTTEDGLLNAGARRTGMKRTCNALIECLQNISSHSAHDENGRMNAFALVSAGENSDHIVCGNLVLASEISQIEKRIQSLSELSRSEIRKLFIETLCNVDFNSKGGAGLGLMTIAKKVEGKIGYTLRALDNYFGYFVIDIHIPH